MIQLRLSLRRSLQNWGLQNWEAQFVASRTFIFIVICYHYCAASNRDSMRDQVSGSSIIYLLAVNLLQGSDDQYRSEGIDLKRNRYSYIAR